MPYQSIHVKGLREVQHGLKRLEGDVDRDLRAALKVAGEPVRKEAERLARTSISHIDERWSRMRSGVTANAVYIVPGARGRGGSSRPNLGQLLLDRAMDPAAESKRDEVTNQVELAIDLLIRKEGF